MSGDTNRQVDRCKHGFLRGVCVMSCCPHWDGLRTWREKEGVTPRVRQKGVRRRRYQPFRTEDR